LVIIGNWYFWHDNVSMEWKDRHYPFELLTKCSKFMIINERICVLGLV